jgi:hypothetical protein
MRPVVSGADDESSAEPDQTSWHDINRQLPFRRKRWHLAGQRLEHYSPVSKLPMMVSAPKRAFRHAAPRGAPPGPASLRNCHDRVVCSWRPRLGNTDTTPGCPGRSSSVSSGETHSRSEGDEIKKGRLAGEDSLAISAASAASRLAAKPLMCLVYE